MTTFRKAALAAAASLSVLAAGQANAVTFNLLSTGAGTAQGTQARRGFEIAAAYWSSVLTNDSTVNLQIGFSALGDGILGSTGSTRRDVELASVVRQLNATGNSALDNTATGTLNGKVVTDASGVSTVAAITSGPALNGVNLGVDTSRVEYDADGNQNNRYIFGNTSVLKAMGLSRDEFTGADFSNVVDGGVTFSSRFAFDFNPTDGIDQGAFDFIGIAIHEIGHALGFVSGVDLYDAYGFPNGSLRNEGAFDFDNPGGGLMSTLDLFRYSDDALGLAPGDGAALDWSVASEQTIDAGGNPFFSIDGENQLFGDSKLSTGRFNGDGFQASHWKEGMSCFGQLGIMDPTICNGTVTELTALDLAAFDAMGWNIDFDVLANSGYRMTTAQIFAAFVPEPGSWAMMIAGFGLMGGVLRRRASRVSFRQVTA